MVGTYRGSLLAVDGHFLALGERYYQEDPYVMVNNFAAGGQGYGGTSVIPEVNQYLPGVLPSDINERNRLLNYRRDTATPKHQLRWNWIADLPFGQGKWLAGDAGLSILNEAANHPLDDWMASSYETAMAHLVGEPGGAPDSEQDEEVETTLTGNDLDLFLKGRAIYGRDGYCGTCHQPDGRGLTAAGFPPLADTRWVTGSEERLIKLTLHGLMGPIEVRGEEYPGNVPMTPFRGLLNDEEIAAVLTFIRNSFGNEASAVSPEKVKEIREGTAGQTGFYSPEELLEEYPLEDEG